MINKTPGSLLTIKTEAVCPNYNNPMGILQGVQLVEWMDIAAAKVGDVITISAKITRAFKSSMEIFVESFAKMFWRAKNI